MGEQPRQPAQGHRQLGGRLCHRRSLPLLRRALQLGLPRDPRAGDVDPDGREAEHPPVQGLRLRAVPRRADGRQGVESQGTAERRLLHRERRAGDEGPALAAHGGPAGAGEQVDQEPRGGAKPQGRRPQARRLDANHGERDPVRQLHPHPGPRGGAGPGAGARAVQGHHEAREPHDPAAGRQGARLQPRLQAVLDDEIEQPALPSGGLDQDHHRQLRDQARGPGGPAAGDHGGDGAVGLGGGEAEACGAERGVQEADRGDRGQDLEDAVGGRRRHLGGRRAHRHPVRVQGDLERDHGGAGGGGEDREHYQRGQDALQALR
mmetsp:Transcript_1956/g.4392  ORF Transcript_1956/g.4392 Transcript_1956/m.4392 type:complete len:320 (+) Transcript_1956:3356-4315(+)